MQTPVVICGYKRSPFHFANKGALGEACVPMIWQSDVIKALISRNEGAKPDDIEDILDGLRLSGGRAGL